MKIIKNKNKDELIKLVSNLIIDELEELAKKQDKIIIGLVGGTSVSQIYEELSKKDSEAWEKCHFFMIDERYVPINSDESNYKLCKDTLLNPLLERDQIQDEFLHPLRTELSGEETAKDYSEQFDTYAGKIDIAIISTGEDGHIGGIFPGKEYTEKSYDYFEDSPKMPPKRISITPSALSRTKTAYTLFLGEGKKEALNKFLNSTNNRTLPQNVLDSIENNIIITDRVTK